MKKRSDTMNDDRISFHDFLHLNYRFIEDPKIIMRSLERLWELPFGEVFPDKTKIEYVCGHLEKGGAPKSLLRCFHKRAFGSVLFQQGIDLEKRRKDEDHIDFMSCDSWKTMALLASLYRDRKG